MVKNDKKDEINEMPYDVNEHLGTVDDELKEELEQNARDIERAFELSKNIEPDENLENEIKEVNEYIKNLYPEGTPKEEAIEILKMEINNLVSQRVVGKFDKFLETKITLLGIKYNKLVWVDSF